MGEHVSFEQLVGKITGNYRLEQLLEPHPWGAIFLACDKEGRRYVLRCINVAAMDGHDPRTPDERLIILGRLQQQANQITGLLHPHILSPVDYGAYLGMLYLVYPYHSYPSLRAHLSPQALPELSAVGRYLEQMAAALEYAHEQAVLHRNLSTSAIFLPDRQRLSIGEFGLLRMREVSQQGITHEDKQGYGFAGSSESCAPEQLLGRPVDVYADTYAIGAVLYRMLTGYAPFNGRTREEVLRQHLYAQVPALNMWRTGLPADLDHVIAKAMAKDPQQRFRSPGELVNAYYQVVDPSAVSKKTMQRLSLETSAPLPIVQPVATKKQLAVTSAQHDPSRRRFVALASIGAGAVVTAAAIGVGAHLIGQNAAMHTTTAQVVPVSVQKTAASPKSVPVKHTGPVLARTNNLPANKAMT